MTLHFKIITNSNVANFERDVNSFMEKNNIMDIKYSTSNTSFSAFIMYCIKEEVKKETQEKIDYLQKVQDEVLRRSFLAANDMFERTK